MLRGRWLLIAKTIENSVDNAIRTGHLFFVNLTFSFSKNPAHARIKAVCGQRAVDRVSGCA